MNYKKVLGSGVVAAMLLATLAPMSFAFAEGQDGSHGGTGDNNTGTSFCAKLDSVETKLNNKELKVTAKVDARKSEQSLNKELHWNDVDTKRETKRTNKEAKRAENFTKKEGKATTPAQIAAVAAYEASVQAAVTAKNNAVDAAVAAYRATVNSTLTDKQASVDAILATYKAALTTALNKAKTDCAAGVDANTVSKNFMTAKKDALVAMNTAKAGIVNVGMTDVVKTAAQTRIDAIKAAENTLKSSIEAAKLALKTAMSGTVNPPSSN